MRTIEGHSTDRTKRSNSSLSFKRSAHHLAPRDLLVQVKAISLNSLGAPLRASDVPAIDTSSALGSNAAGLVIATGSEVENFQLGDAVFWAGDLNRPGAESEYRLVDERVVARKPETLDWGAAAALPLPSITAWDLLFERLRVPYGCKTARGALLVIDGAGDIGSILVQFARRLTGLTVIATTALATSDPWLREMGAHHVIDERASLDNELRRIGIPEVEYVASLSCSEKWLAMFPQILKPHGHLALVDDPKSFDVVPLKQKSVTISMESRSMTAGFEHAIRRRHAILQEVADLVDAGVLRTIMTRQEAPICADTLRRCYAISESGRSVGKVVLSGFV